MSKDKKAQRDGGCSPTTCSGLLDRLYWWAFDRARTANPCGMWAFRRVAALLTAVKHFQRGNHSRGLAWCVRIVFWPRAKPNSICS